MESGRRRRWRRETRAPTDLGRLVPNRLSIELVPNRLSILEGRRGATSGMPAAGRTVPATVAERSERPRTAVRPAGRRINLSTLVFIGFIAFWVLSRVLDVIPEGGAVATASPPALPTASRTPMPVGTVEFGARQGGGCTVVEVADTFAAGSQVWWSARFAAPLQPTDRVRWMVFRGGSLVEEGLGPSDRPTGQWTGICGTDPLSHTSTGTYALRVLHISAGDLLAEGTFTIR